jgi:outer membrane immunogenic protein
MRSRLLAAVGLLASATTCAGPAGAADVWPAPLPVYAPQPVYAPRPAPPPYLSEWTGFYFGFDGGGAWDRASFDPALSLLTGPVPGATASGAVFGGHAGYNWQYGPLVGGVEVDYTSTNLTSTSPFALGTLATKESRLDQLGTARGRFGYAVLPNVLAYGTAGAGWGYSRLTVNFPVSGVSERAFVNEFGWVAGGGVEYRLFEHIQLRAEYLHYDFGESSASLPIRPVSQRDRVDIIRGGISYKF